MRRQHPYVKPKDTISSDWGDTMKSIKPGRGPSAMGAAGSLFAVIFGIFWTIMAFSITRDAPFPLVGIVFPLFGFVFIGFGIVQAVYHFKNATGRNRMSTFDIVDADREPDPLDRFAGRPPRASRGNESADRSADSGGKSFCPYCGDKIEASYRYCPKCGESV
ncbi:MULTISPECIES: zinc ribbon domain-containing protein [Paenibacillus]|uniref:zinc ribbon domain-containing protein n=1 Tax=Paenibacillus TaxID=44249 RepID=UPI0027D96113|nr:MULTISPECIES: zinc ribbon domain-containing protein [Paenibacillus]